MRIPNRSRSCPLHLHHSSPIPLEVAMGYGAVYLICGLVILACLALKGR